MEGDLPRDSSKLPRVDHRGSPRSESHRATRHRHETPEELRYDGALVDRPSAFCGYQPKLQRILCHPSKEARSQRSIDTRAQITAQDGTLGTGL